MKRQLALLAPLAIIIALAGCTGPVTADRVSTDQPTVAPESPAATSVVGIVWGDDKPYLKFNSDGTYEGNAGCNGISGDWEQEGDIVTFGPMAQTDMACEDSPDWVVPPASATVTAASLTLLDAEGDVIDELSAQN
jgi:heat shock protein HslJ